MPISVPSLAQYLADNNDISIDFRLRVVNIDADGKAECYLHPLNVDGETVDFNVVDNSIEILNLPLCPN